MGVLFVIGRIAFVLIFILSGAQKLMDVGATAAMIETKIIVPPEVSEATIQIQNLTGMALPQLLAIAAGLVEVVGGLLIAANFGTRAGAAALLLFTGAATYYFHDFWNMAEPDRTANMIQAMKNLSIMGALLVFLALGQWRPAAERYGQNLAERF
jgi:uncharacterized membrane protein YphA (DoxX/SURF4 family)